MHVLCHTKTEVAIAFCRGRFWAVKKVLEIESGRIEDHSDRTVAQVLPGNFNPDQYIVAYEMLMYIYMFVHEYIFSKEV